MAVEGAPAAAPDPHRSYYTSTRQKDLDLAEKRYKTTFRFRAQEYIRGRGTTAVIDDEVCMGCTHCFDNCAFEAIDMADRKFAFPQLSYTSRKAVIIVENCVGCEKCAIVCPVDAIDMIPKAGYEFREGRLTPLGGLPQAARPTPLAPRPPAAASKPTPVAPAPRV